MSYEWIEKTIYKKKSGNPIQKMKMCEQILKKNKAGRIQETTRSRKLPILITKQQEKIL